MLENSCIMSGLCVEGPAPLQLAHFLSRHHHIQHDWSTETGFFPATGGLL